MAAIIVAAGKIGLTAMVESVGIKVVKAD